MMKYYFYVLIFIVSFCLSSAYCVEIGSAVLVDRVLVSNIASTIKPNIPLNKADIHKTERITFKEFYNKVILPLYSSYTKSEFPQTFTVDSSDLTINAGAAFKYLQISLGLVRCTDDTIQMYSIAHELGHIVTLEQAERLNLGHEVPRGKTFNSYQKGELLADLMSVYTMSVRSSDYNKAIERRKPIFYKLFSDGNYAHPSGKIRVEYMNKFFNRLAIQKPKDAMEEIFTEIWQMN